MIPIHPSDINDVSVVVLVGHYWTILDKLSPLKLSPNDQSIDQSTDQSTD